MTRDEAYQIAARACYPDDGGGQQSISMMIVNSLAALGMLKLDGPERPEKKAFEALNKLNTHQMSPGRILCALDAAGLRIVEK